MNSLRMYFKPEKQITRWHSLDNAIIVGMQICLVHEYVGGAVTFSGTFNKSHLHLIRVNVCVHYEILIAVCYEASAKSNQIYSSNTTALSGASNHVNGNWGSMGVKEWKGTGKAMLSPGVAWKCQALENWLFPSGVYSTGWEVSQESLRYDSCPPRIARLLGKLYRQLLPATKFRILKTSSGEFQLQKLSNGPRSKNACKW